MADRSANYFDRPLTFALYAIALQGCYGCEEASRGLNDIFYGPTLVIAGVFGILGLLLINEARKSVTVGSLVAISLLAALVAGLQASATEGFRPWPGSIKSGYLVLLWLPATLVLAAFVAGARFTHDRVTSARVRVVAWTTAGALAFTYCGLLSLACISNTLPSLDGHIESVAISDDAAYAITDQGVVVTAFAGMAIPRRYRSLVASRTGVYGIDANGRVDLIRRTHESKQVPFRAPVRTVVSDDARICAALTTGKAECIPLVLDDSLASWPSVQSFGASKAVLEDLEDVREVVVSSEHVCGLTATGQLRCRGGGETSVDVSGASSPVTTIKEVCWLDGSKVVHCANLESGADKSPTERVEAVKLVAGKRHVCALLADGEVRCWGENSSWQLTQDSNKGSAAAVKIALPGPARTLLGFATSTCAFLTDESFICWGSQRERGALIMGATCDKPLLAPPTRCARMPQGFRLPTTFVPFRETGARRGR